MSNHDGELCETIAIHPELGELSCTLPVGHDGSHAAPDPETPGEQVLWDDEPAGREPGAVFDVEAFVKALPEGVCLCPLCLGAGGVVEEPPFDPHTHRCPTCQGRGRTRTGSLVSDQAERPCVDCEGRGYLDNEPGAPAALPARSSDFANGVTPRDRMGRTPDDPDYDWTAVVQGVVPVPEPEPV